MGLISRWLQANASVRTAWGRAEAADVESRKEAGEATATHDVALASAASAKEHCSRVEAEG